MDKILVTGGCGFIGSNFVRNYLKKNPEGEIVNLDKLTYCGRKENLADIAADKEIGKRYKFVKGDICNQRIVSRAMKDCDAVVHFAAETHVDRSIKDPMHFLQTDVIGTATLLEEARKHKLKKFVHISTDEVYGHILEGSFTEESVLNPRNPYSASKAGADRLVCSYFNTYAVPALIVRPSNNFGPYQYPEKILPLFITNLMRNKKVPLYGDGKNVRDWLFVLDNCEAIELCLKKGKIGEVYNVAGGNELSNIELTKLILEEFGHGEEMIQFVQDRLGHDKRYSMSSEKIRNELGWKPIYEFKKALRNTVEWYKNNEKWWKTLIMQGDLFD
ncbi:MAG: dTDP-glucose 4,6-dehydratase [archaeon]